MTRMHQGSTGRRPPVAAFTRVLVLGAVGGLVLALNGAPAQSSDFVRSVVKAPVSPDGDVAGAVTDIVIDLAFDPDPSVAGLKLRAGERVRVTLPQGFDFADPDGYPVRAFLSGEDCAPNLVKCTSAVFLHGWPQHPILPVVPTDGTEQYGFDYDADDNAFILTAVTDLEGAPMPGPGAKQIHLLTLGVRNPETAGDYPIEVSVIGADGRVTHSGTGIATIRAAPAPSINVTSVFVPNDVNEGRPPNPNTIYQQTTAGAPAPMPWDFLVWDATGGPFTGLEAVQRDDSGGNLVRASEVVGSFTFETPEGASGQQVSGGPAIEIADTPVIGASFGKPVPAGRLTLHFTAGDTPGRYVTTFELLGGNSVSMVTDVTAE